MIEFHNITKIFGEKKVLDEINIRIEPGEFVSVIGASGAGKSTLFHLLIGALATTIGCVEVDGIVIGELDKETLQLYRRKVGMIFQDYKLLHKKTVYENIAFALEVCSASDEEIEKRVTQVIDVVGLQGAEGRFPHELSGGEQQRVAIARALVHKPNLILADEPTGNLDPQNTEEIIDLLKKINESGVTVILATHDKSVVDLLQKRVIHLENGKITNDAVGGY